MEFRKYQHIERFGTTEVEGIAFDPYIVLDIGFATIHGAVGLTAYKGSQHAKHYNQ